LDNSLDQWIGVVGGSLIKVSRQSATLLGGVRPSTNFSELVEHYFSIRDDLEQTFSTFPTDDPFLSSALSKFSGLRLLTQDPWECLISFVCSINCNIPSIKLKIENLSKRFGSRIESRFSERYHSFPTARALSKAEKNDLLSCKLGFRWKYVKFIAEQVEKGTLDLDRIGALPYKEALNELMSETSGNTFGVGPKVADCVLLYSFHKTEAFPLDVWIMKYVQRIYEMQLETIPKSLTPKNYLLIGDAMRKKFGVHAGYAQLYLYEKIRRDGFTQKTLQA